MIASQDHIAQGLRELYKFDLDPRVSLACRPFSNDKTLIRGLRHLCRNHDEPDVIQQRGQPHLQSAYQYEFAERR
ncbi:MAG TPA: hypothetical protein VGE83_00275 [Terracidiphilus sp.]|jgi:hypothetical protein